MASNLKRVTATGNVVTYGGYLKSIILVAAAAAADLDVRLDGASGSIALTLAAVIEGSAVWHSPDSKGVLFPGALHATLTGAGSIATFEIEP